MTTAAFLLLALALVAAVIDWVAVHDQDTKLEYLCKPATVALLILAAFAVEPDSEAMRSWFVAALLFSLAGDVALMLKQQDLFVVGLGAFLLAHAAYIGGFVAGGLEPLALLVGVFVAGFLVGAVGVVIVLSARRKEPKLAVPVQAYIGVIGLMLVMAIGSTRGVAIVGALLFVASDAMIGWNRFVKPFPWLPLAIMVTYHLAQACLVVSLT
jgi:uncharacterized membrane protein YhhN